MAGFAKRKTVNPFSKPGGFIQKQEQTATVELRRLKKKVEDGELVPVGAVARISHMTRSAPGHSRI
jgi:hypothetical protein